MADRQPLAPVVWRAPAAPPRSRSPWSTPPMPSVDVWPVTGFGAEDVALDADGRVLTGVADGRILRVSNGGATVETVAVTGGRPLGIEVADDGSLVVCDAVRGLLRVDLADGASAEADGARVTLLADAAAGERIRVCNNAAVAADGTVYFTDSSRRFDLERWKGDLFEHSGTGRLLRRDLSGEVSVLLDGLHFANGVALSRDGSFVAVAETGAYRVRRVWLSGARAGSSDVLVDNLPGIPDNMSTGSDGLLWVALPSARDSRLDLLLRTPPVLRRITWALPESWQPRPRRTVWAVALDDTGALVRDLQRDGDRFHFVTGVRERDGRLYVGSLQESAVGVVRLP